MHTVICLQRYAHVFIFDLIIYTALLNGFAQLHTQTHPDVFLFDYCLRINDCCSTCRMRNIHCVYLIR